MVLENTSRIYHVTGFTQKRHSTLAIFACELRVTRALRLLAETGSKGVVMARQAENLSRRL